MKQILQRRINKLNSVIPTLDNNRVVEEYKDTVILLTALLNEYNSLKKIETLSKSSTDIKYLLYIFAKQFEYTDPELLDLMLIVTSFNEEHLIDFIIEIRPTDIEDWKQNNPDWMKYFKT